jgi:hypothetical protein
MTILQKNVITLQPSGIREDFIAWAQLSRQSITSNVVYMDDIIQGEKQTQDIPFYKCWISHSIHIYIIITIIIPPFPHVFTES